MAGSNSLGGAVKFNKFQQETYFFQVEISHEMINIKQAEAEKRRSAVRRQRVYS